MAASSEAESASALRGGVRGASGASAAAVSGLGLGLGLGRGRGPRLGTQRGERGVGHERRGLRRARLGLQHRACLLGRGLGGLLAGRVRLGVGRDLRGRRGLRLGLRRRRRGRLGGHSLGCGGRRRWRGGLGGRLGLGLGGGIGLGRGSGLLGRLLRLGFRLRGLGRGRLRGERRGLHGLRGRLGRGRRPEGRKLRGGDDLDRHLGGDLGRPVARQRAAEHDPADQQRVRPARDGQRRVRPDAAEPLPEAAPEPARRAPHGASRPADRGAAPTPPAQSASRAGARPLRLLAGPGGSLRGPRGVAPRHRRGLAPGPTVLRASRPPPSEPRGQRRRGGTGPPRGAGAGLGGARDDLLRGPDAPGPPRDPARPAGQPLPPGGEAAGGALTPRGHRSPGPRSR